MPDFHTDLFHGLFVLHYGDNGAGRLARHAAAPRVVPDPHTGHPLKVAALELSERAVCPACTQLGAGGTSRSSPTCAWRSRARAAANLSG